MYFFAYCCKSETEKKIRDMKIWIFKAFVVTYSNVSTTLLIEDLFYLFLAMLVGYELNTYKKFWTQVCRSTYLIITFWTAFNGQFVGNLNYYKVRAEKLHDESSMMVGEKVGNADKCCLKKQRKLHFRSHTDSQIYNKHFESCYVYFVG